MKKKLIKINNTYLLGEHHTLEGGRLHIQFFFHRLNLTWQLIFQWFHFICELLLLKFKWLKSIQHNSHESPILNWQQRINKHELTSISFLAALNSNSSFFLRTESFSFSNRDSSDWNESFSQFLTKCLRILQEFHKNPTMISLVNLSISSFSFFPSLAPATCAIRELIYNIDQ